MNNKLQDFIERAVFEAHISGKKQIELRNELISHIIEEERELQLQGYSEEKIITTITGQFGNPEKIGNEFFTINMHYMQAHQRNGIILMSILSGLLFPYFGSTDPLTLIMFATCITTLTYLIFFARKNGTAGLRYVLCLTIILFWNSIVLSHQGAMPYSGDYGTIGFPLPFYRELVKPLFSFGETWVYFLLDYLFFLGISWISYIVVVKRFWKNSYNSFITAAAVMSMIVGFMWLLNVYD